jgi:hypothetical protein
VAGFCLSTGAYNTVRLQWSPETATGTGLSRGNQREEEYQVDAKRRSDTSGRR